MRREGSVRGAQVGIDGPIFLRLELLDFRLALADQPQRHRLHAARGSRARQFAPQHRREVEADEIIERAAGEIGIDQLFVDGARMGDGVEHGRAGDGIEYHPLHMGMSECVFLLQDLQHMPGNGLALAVGVGGEDQLVGAFDGVGDLLDPLLGARIDVPDHGEIVVRLDRTVLGRQVADMAEAGQTL